MNELKPFYQKCIFRRYDAEKKDNLSKFVPLFSIKTTNKSCICQATSLTSTSVSFQQTYVLNSRQCKWSNAQWYDEKILFQLFFWKNPLFILFIILVNYQFMVLKLTFIVILSFISCLSFISAKMLWI